MFSPLPPAGAPRLGNFAGGPASLAAGARRSRASRRRRLQSAGAARGHAAPCGRNRSVRAAAATRPLAAARTGPRLPLNMAVGPRSSAPRPG